MIEKTKKRITNVLRAMTGKSEPNAPLLESTDIPPLIEQEQYVTVPTKKRGVSALLGEMQGVIVEISFLPVHNGNRIHRTAVIDPTVQLGYNNYIGEYCVIKGDTIIGDNNRFEAFCSIGTEPEHMGFAGKPHGGVGIGDHNTFREFITVNAGTIGHTVICNHVWMLKGSHVGHDSIIEDHCILSCGVLIGGESYLFEHVNMGLNAVCHQRSIIGAYCMVGMGAVVTKQSKMRPAGVYIGNPCRYSKLNSVGLDKGGIDADTLLNVHQVKYERMIARKEKK